MSNEKDLPLDSNEKKVLGTETISNNNQNDKIQIEKSRNPRKKSIKIEKRDKNPKHTNFGNLNYPRHSIEKSLRIPRAILEQNAGQETLDKDAAKFLGIHNTKGPFSVELSSATKYGLLERPSAGYIKLTDLAKRILRPQNQNDEIKGLRESFLKAPILSDVYKHYRGENLPDRQFFENTLVDTFKIPIEKTSEFIEIFKESLKNTKLIEENNGKERIIDIASESDSPQIDTSKELKKLSKNASINTTDTCFVMMPFSSPLGAYYDKIYVPAITKTGLKPIRADDDLFGTGKIIDQIWNGINSSKVLIAELTNRNPNVYYELGLAHALKKPVVLVCSNEQDVPFDLKHIRVIYYDVYDPFWGTKLIDKIAENILSAIGNPKDTILFS